MKDFMNKVLVTGSLGQLGSSLKELETAYNQYTFFRTDYNDLDITNKSAIEDFVIKHGITIIINCAAYTAVDKAEDEVELADKINHTAAENLATVSKKYNVKFVHISTDYVFDGTANIPYKETGITNPKSVYGVTKLKGEQKILDLDINAIIIRTSWLYSKYNNNFFKTITKLAKDRDVLKVVFDQTGTPTYAKDLAKAILELLSIKEAEGVYHFSNEGVCSWYDFALEIVKNQKIDCKIIPVYSDEFPTKAKRPSYSVLDKSKIKSHGISVPYWKDSLIDLITNSKN